MAYGSNATKLADIKINTVAQIFVKTLITGVNSNI